MHNFRIIKKSNVVASKNNSVDFSDEGNDSDKDISDVYEEVTNAEGNTWDNVFNLAATDEVESMIKGTTKKFIVK